MHRPVLAKEAIDYLSVHEGGFYADLTFGDGGHTELILEKKGAGVVAIDRDPVCIERYKKEGKFKHDPRLQFIHSHFSAFSEVVVERFFDGILLDLGVSTRQLLEPERGFSLKEAGPLDMRMDTSQGLPLLEKLKQMGEAELANELWRNTGHKRSRTWAKKIVAALTQDTLHNTLDLARLAGYSPSRNVHPATVLFLGLRMMVNQELAEVESILSQAISHLKPRGRLVVITFHSVEDRLVKTTFRKIAGLCVCGLAELCRCPKIPLIRQITLKPVIPTQAELRSNPRSRSSKLRCVEKI